MSAAFGEILSIISFYELEFPLLNAKL